MAFDPVTYALCAELVEEAVGDLEPGYEYKGSVATYEDLPSSGNEKGDLWQVRSSGAEFAWDGTQWVERGYDPIPDAYIRAAFN